MVGGARIQRRGRADLAPSATWSHRRAQWPNGGCEVGIRRCCPPRSGRGARMRRRARLLSNRVSVVLEVVLAVLPPVAKAARPAPVQTAQPAVCVIVRELVLRAPRGLIVQVLVIYLAVRYGEVPGHPEPLRECDNVRAEVAHVGVEVEDARPVGSHSGQHGRARRRAVGHLRIMCLSELDRARSEMVDVRREPAHVPR